MISRLSLVFALLLFMIPGQNRGQVVYSESFNLVPVNTSLPLGWSQGIIGSSSDTNNVWKRSANGIQPNIPPRTGAGLMAYRSHQIIAGESSFLASKRFDMRNAMPVGGATFNFWFYRTNSGFPANSDRIQVYVNDSAVVSGGAGGALLLNENVTGSSVIHRSCNLSPAIVTCDGWNNFAYTIPNVAPFNGASVYVIIVGVSDLGRDINLDDFTFNTYPLAQTYVASSAAVTYQNTITTAAGFTDQLIIGCKMTMSGTTTPRVLSNMEFNTNGSSNPPGDIQSAKLWFSGGTSIFSFDNAVLLGTYNNPWLTNYTFLTAPNANYSGMANFNGLQHGDNYFWLTYDIRAAAVGGHVVDAEWINLSLNGTVQAPPNPVTLPGNRLIDLEYCQPQYTTGFQMYLPWADYVNSVVLVGDNVPVPGINNNMNWVTGCSGFTGFSLVNTLCGPPYPRSCPFQCAPPNYELFAEVPGKTTRLTANGTTVYPISIQVGNIFIGNTVAAWIDYNRNGIFEGSERITQSGLLGANATHNASFIVPVTALPGKTRLRVREAWLTTNMDPCNNRVFGEAEDYVVTIVPDCPSTPGWTTWLGITDDWADPNNWCPAKVPMLGNVPDVNVLIPGGPSGTGYVYKHPVIKSSMPARAIKLRIEALDTVFVNATSGSSLTVLDSLDIKANTSSLIVNTTHTDTAQVFNGLLSRPLDSPLTSSQRSHSYLAFTQADLLSQGMAAGDEIISIRMHMQRKSNGNAYRNFELKYFYTTNAQALFNIGVAANIPLPVGLPASPQTVYAGNLDITTVMPVVNDFGTIELILSAPIIWNGGANPLIIEMCYDNTGFPTTGANDEFRFTQTTSLRRYMNIENLSAYPKPGCDISPKDTIISPSTGTAGSNLLTVNPVDAPEIMPGQLTSLGSQVVSIAGNVVTLTSNLAANVNGNVTFFNTVVTSLIFRPNLTFRYNRPYEKFPIIVGGHWNNNGTFIPAVSRVTLNGGPTVIANQRIGGASSTTFYDLTISNANHVIRIRNFTVTDTLWLNTGRLKLNNGLATLTNNAPSAIYRTSGYIQAEMDVLAANAFPFGRIRWQMGSTPGLRIIPFANPANTPVFMDYNIDSGTHDVILGTFNTAANNLNLPLPEVTNIYGFNGTVWNSNGSTAVDRFYIVKDSLGVAPQADITFRWAPAERAANNPSGALPMSAQRWISATDYWEFPFVAGQTYVADQVTVPNYTGFNTADWWTVVGNNTPLPVSLLEFTARQYKDRMKLMWSTASEINNSHFDIERTTDHISFDFISRVESQGPGNNTQEYVTWDYRPLEGLQYYYLRQVDFDGKVTSYGPVSANFSNAIFAIVSTTVSPGDKGVTVVFNYNSTEPYSYRILDMLGRVIVAKDRNAAVEGINVIDIKTNLANGIYNIVLQNNEKIVAGKFFY